MNVASSTRWRNGFRLTLEGQLWFALAFTLALIGWYKKINITLLVAYVMAGLVVVNLVLARLHARRVQAARVPPRPVFANEPAHAAVTISYRHSHGGSVEVIDTVADSTVRWFVHGAVEPGEVLHQPRTVPGRGQFPCEPLRVDSGFPFGLVRYTLAMPADGLELVVLPARGRIDLPGMRRWLSQAGGEAGQRRRPLRRITSDQADVRGVRPFRPGDSLRWIHWRTTARRGEPMVREYDVPPSPSLLLVVDPWLPASPGDVDRQRLEEALELAVSIAIAVCGDEGSRLTLVVPGMDIVPRVSGSTSAALLASLTPLAAVEGRPDVPVPVLNAAGMHSAARLVVSSRANSPLPDALSRATGRPFRGVDAMALPAWYLPPSKSTR